MYETTEYKLAKNKLDEKFKKKWSNIIQKYSNVQDEGDIVDLENIEIVQDNGHLRSIRTDSSIRSIYNSDEENSDSNDDMLESGGIIIQQNKVKTPTKQTQTLKQFKQRKSQNYGNESKIMRSRDSSLTKKYSETQPTEGGIYFSLGRNMNYSDDEYLQNYQKLFYNDDDYGVFSGTYSTDEFTASPTAKKVSREVRKPEDNKLLQRIKLMKNTYTALEEDSFELDNDFTDSAFEKSGYFEENESEDEKDGFLHYEADREDKRSSDCKVKNAEIETKSHSGVLNEHSNDLMNASIYEKYLSESKYLIKDITAGKVFNINHDNSYENNSTSENELDQESKKDYNHSSVSADTYTDENLENECSDSEKNTTGVIRELKHDNYIETPKTRQDSEKVGIQNSVKNRKTQSIHMDATKTRNMLPSDSEEYEYVTLGSGNDDDEIQSSEDEQFHLIDINEEVEEFDTNIEDDSASPVHEKKEKILSTDKRKPVVDLLNEQYQDIEEMFNDDTVIKYLRTSPTKKLKY